MAKRGRVGAEQLTALREKIKGLHLQGVPLPEIATALQLSPETVRKHIYVIRKQWSEEGPDAAQSRMELLQRVNLIGKMAAAGAARARGSKEEATFLKLQLEVVDRLAKLTGAYMGDVQGGTPRCEQGRGELPLARLARGRVAGNPVTDGDRLGILFRSCV
jgi:hypothetical protein